MRTIRTMLTAGIVALAATVALGAGTASADAESNGVKWKPRGDVTQGRTWG